MNEDLARLGVQLVTRPLRGLTAASPRAVRPDMCEVRAIRLAHETEVASDIPAAPTIARHGSTDSPVTRGNVSSRPPVPSATAMTGPESGDTRVKSPPTYTVSPDATTV